MSNREYLLAMLANNVQAGVPSDPVDICQAAREVMEDIDARSPEILLAAAVAAMAMNQMLAAEDRRVASVVKLTVEEE